MVADPVWRRDDQVSRFDFFSRLSLPEATLQRLHTPTSIPTMRTGLLMASSIFSRAEIRGLNTATSQQESLGVRSQASAGRGIDPNLAARIADPDLWALPAFETTTNAGAPLNIL